MAADPAPSPGGARSAAGQAEARPNAQTHGLFSSKGGKNPVRLARMADLESLFAKAAAGEAEHACAHELAELQSQLEDIRALRVRVWDEAFQEPSIQSEEGRVFRMFTVFSQRALTNKSQDIDVEMEIATQLVLGIHDEPRHWQSMLATQQVSRRLLTLYGYEQRLMGRRRKVMRRWLRLQCDRSNRTGRTD